MYTTAQQTQATIISSYNLAREMADLPSSLYQGYVTPWTRWSNVYAGNTYGNVVGWINAANTGHGVNNGYQGASINPAVRYPLYGNLSPESQQLVAAQGATSDLGDGVHHIDCYHWCAVVRHQNDTETVVQVTVGEIQVGQARRQRVRRPGVETEEQ
jgi:hypothetical protein